MKLAYRQNGENGQDMHNYEIKEKIVKKGESKIFKNWNEFSGVSMEDFLKGLKWVCEDPEEDFGNGIIRMTRELGCRPNGELVKLKRANSKTGDFLGFYIIETGLLWNGNVSINCRERV